VTPDVFVSTADCVSASQVKVLPERSFRIVNVHGQPVETIAAPGRSRVDARRVLREPLEFLCPNPYLRRRTIPGIPMSTTNPLQFLQQVRAEVAKVVWPTRREVLLTTLMVFLLSALAATFFSLVDLGIRTALTYIIGA
jgi:preprotein translocase subunit SecE